MYGRALWRLIYPLTNWCLQTNKSPFQTFQLIWRHLNVLASQWHSLATLARLIALSHVNEWARTRSHLCAIPLRLCELRYTTITFHLWFRFEMRLKHLSMMYFSCSWFRKALGLSARAGGYSTVSSTHRCWSEKHSEAQAAPHTILITTNVISSWYTWQP